MNNTGLAHLNNRSVDALFDGDIDKAFRILSPAFFHAAKVRHRAHHAARGRTTANKGDSASLEFSLHACSRKLTNTLRNGFKAELGHCLSLNLLRIELPCILSEREAIDKQCICRLVWALGYNLSIIYCLLGYQQPQSSQGQLMQKAIQIMVPIKRQVMMHPSTSQFWATLKLSILNNYVCMLQERGSSPIEVHQTIQVMDLLISESRSHLDPIDVQKYYLAMQILNVGSSTAAAA